MDLEVQAILEAATRKARQAFRGLPDKEERIADVQSVAWELSLRASDKATPGTLAAYAVLRVTVRRQFAESLRCLETLPKEKNASRHIFRRVAFDPKGYASMRDNPAEVASFRVDLPAWLASLTPQQRETVKMLAVGERNGIVARRLNVSPQRVCELRHELAKSWIAAHS